MEEVRSYWQVASITHFCTLFQKPFKLPIFEPEELEQAFILDIPVPPRPTTYFSNSNQNQNNHNDIKPIDRATSSINADESSSAADSKDTQDTKVETNGTGGGGGGSDDDDDNLEDDQHNDSGKQDDSPDYKPPKHEQFQPPPPPPPQTQQQTDEQELHLLVKLAIALLKPHFNSKIR